MVRLSKTTPRITQLTYEAGEALGDVFSTYGLEARHTSSNNVFEMLKCLRVATKMS